MPQISRCNLMQDMAVRENIKRPQGTLGPHLSKGVQQHLTARLKPRNRGAVLTNFKPTGDHNPPGLRAISIAPPAHKTEDLTRIKEVQRPAFIEPIGHRRTPKKQPVIGAIFYHP